MKNFKECSVDLNWMLAFDQCSVKSVYWFQQQINKIKTAAKCTLYVICSKTCYINFLTGFDNVDTPSEIQKCSNGFEFQFDSKGSLVHLKDPASQVSSRNLLLLSNWK